MLILFYMLIIYSTALLRYLSPNIRLPPYRQCGVRGWAFLIDQPLNIALNLLVTLVELSKES